MRIVIGDVEAEALDAAVARLAESGAEAVGIVTDVGDASAVQALADATAAMGGLDTVLIAHGTLTDQPKGEADVGYALREIGTNGTSVVSLMTLAGEQFAVTFDEKNLRLTQG